MEILHEHDKNIRRVLGAVLVSIIEAENEQMELIPISDNQKIYMKKFTYKDYECEVVRVPHSGHLCGYVNLKDDDEMVDLHNNDFDVHGGISYTDADNAKIGFDCNHFNDLSPINPHLGGDYRELDFVIKECKILVNQVIEKRD